MKNVRGRNTNLYLYQSLCTDIIIQHTPWRRRLQNRVDLSNTFTCALSRRLHFIYPYVHTCTCTCRWNCAQFTALKWRDYLGLVTSLRQCYFCIIHVCMCSLYAGRNNNKYMYMQVYTSSNLKLIQKLCVNCYGCYFIMQNYSSGLFYKAVGQNQVSLSFFLQCVMKKFFQ